MELSAGFKKYFANTSWLLFGQIARSIIALFMSMYVARYLGPSRYGLLSYAVSFVTLFLAIATLGLDSIVIRDLVKYESKRDELLGTAFALKCIGALLMLGIIAIVIRFTAEDSFTISLIFIIGSAAVFQSFGVIAFYFQAKVLSKYAVCAQTASAIFSAIIKLLLIHLKAELIYFAVVMVLESAIVSTGLTVAYRRQKMNILNWRIGLNLARTMLKDSFPLILAGISVGIFMRIDQVMVKWMINSEAVGNYAIAVKLSEAWYFIPVAIAGSVFPAIINASKVSQKLYQERLQSLYTLMIWLSIVTALPITFLAGSIIELFFGEQYLHAAGVLRIYIWSLVFCSLGVASGKYLLAENYTRISFLRTIVSMVINVLLNIILIPRYQLNGAAIATLFSQFTVAFFIGLIPKTSRQAVLMLKSFSPVSMINFKWKENLT